MNVLGQAWLILDAEDLNAINLLNSIAKCSTLRVQAEFFSKSF